MNSPAAVDLAFPIRAAFYYPWFPNAWNQSGMDPFTHYHPSLGYYSQDDPTVIEKHIQAMQYGNIQAGIASWWGMGHHTDQRIPALLEAGETAGFHWALYYEDESQGDPAPSTILTDLEYIRDQYASSPAYLTIDGRFVVFVYADPADACGMVERWQQANTVGAYLVLKVFAGYRACATQPDGWHQYGPAVADDRQDSYSYTISPGFWKADEAAPRLERSEARWINSVKTMVAAQTDFHLITSFNEWGEGTSVEDASEWESESGFGNYLDVLHYNGDLPRSLYPHDTYLPTAVSRYRSVVNFIGAGDIADCKLSGAAETAKLLSNYQEATIFTLGDNTYPNARPSEFANCFDPTWGRYKERIYPASGNHEYHTTRAAGYFGYFGAAAGEPEKGYYSYDLDGWHIIVLNSNCDQVGGCEAGSEQETWLKADLAAHPNLCTLAYWHHPLFSSGYHGNNPEVQGLWRALYDAGVDLVLNGHDHNYERFAPMTPDGALDLQSGIRQFVVGTGGGALRTVSEPFQPNSEKVISGGYGVLLLRLAPGRYTWEFKPTSAKTARDVGEGECHP